MRSLLDDRNSALEELQAVFEQQSLKTTNYETTRQELEKRISQAIMRKEELEERNANLESALQGSLQHTAEQEEALILREMHRDLAQQILRRLKVLASKEKAGAPR